VGFIIFEDDGIDEGITACIKRLNIESEPSLAEVDELLRLPPSQ
jgi:hypothetical protein